ncbi:MAG TPA: hypothetical protein VH062_11720 [Polyangiaceae bacterium]|nr:hypothetical protein [Polyangiaceae bacterium]
MKRTLRRGLSRSAALLTALVAGCSGPKASQTTTLSTPDEATFPPVSDALEVRCGTLDCHGSIYRNLRMYGIYGVRADAKDVTGTGATTADEYARNYVSFIGLAPEALSAIVQTHGQGIEHFIVITKGTNAEDHKGGQRMKKGDSAYQCLTSWISGTIDMNACTDASAITPPGGDGF